MKTISFLLVLTIGLNGFGQSICRELISTSGNFHSNGNINLSWSLGELATETSVTPGVILTQGFQQPDITGLQFLMIPEGWSGISTYLIPAQKQIDGMFDPLGLNLHILYNQQGIYWPDGGLYTLQEWNFKSGYVINSNIDVTLPVQGYLTRNKSVQLAAGWSIMPVLSTVETSLDVFSPLSGHLKVVKDVGGTGVYWPEMAINSLHSLIPGKAYYIMLTDADSLIFGLDTKNVSAAPKPLSSTCEAWEVVESTPTSHVFGVKHEALSLFDKGDFVGAFNKNGKCVGSTQINSKLENLALTVFGSDDVPNQNYAIMPGEEISFRVWRTQNQQQLNISPVFANTGKLNNAYFVVNGISVVETFIISQVAVNEIPGDDIQVFPNPARGIFTITGFDDDAEIFIHNVVGEISGYFNVVKETQAVFDFTGKEPGLYFIKIKSGSKVFTNKLVLL